MVGYPDFDRYKICATYHHAVNNQFSRAQIFKERLSPSFLHRETLLVLLKYAYNLSFARLRCDPLVKHHVVLKCSDSVTTELYSYLFFNKS